MDTTDYVEYMILPRMSALSEVVWSSKEARNWNDFSDRLDTFKDRFDTLGLNYAKHVFKKEEVEKVIEVEEVKDEEAK